jgi:hypothetical protein
MKDFEQILRGLKGAGFTDFSAQCEVHFWHFFVNQIPVGTRVYHDGRDGDVRETLDGRFYDDANDKYVLVTNGGAWNVRSVRKAPDTKQ